MKYPHPWSCCSFHDTAKRRGIWFRKTKDGVEVCAGREGDDDHVLLTVGEVVTEETVRKLFDCLHNGAHELHDSEYNARVKEATAEQAAGKTVDWLAISESYDTPSHQLPRDHIPSCTRHKS